MEIFEVKNGYQIGYYNEKTGQYTRPMNNREQRITGCHTYYAGSPECLGGTVYKSKASARKAIWREENSQEYY